MGRRGRGTRQTGDGRCPVVYLAGALADAGSVAEMEGIVGAELRRWGELELAWCTITGLVPGAARVGDARSAALGRILLRLPPDAHEPVRVPLPLGEAVAAPCGSRSGLVLVVAAGRDIPAETEQALADLAALVGLAARTVAASAEIERRRGSSRFEEVIRYASDAVFIVDSGGTIRYAAPSVTTVLGHRSAELDGDRFSVLIDPRQHTDLESFLRTVALEAPRRPATIEMRCRRGDGTMVPVEVTGANLLGNEDVRGIVLTVRDVSARRELEAQLRHKAFHDPLTGLPNRALFADRLDRAMQVRRDGRDLGPAVAFVDLDDFKDINDSLGHAVGDVVLQTIGQRIAGCVRAADTAARLGGDEFAILIEDVTNETAVDELVARVTAAVEEPVTVGRDETVRVRASVGVATCTDDVTSGDDLLRHADIAMYRDKVATKATMVDLDGAGTAERLSV